MAIRRALPPASRISRKIHWTAKVGVAQLSGVSLSFTVWAPIFATASAQGVLAQYTGTTDAPAVDLRQTCVDLRQTVVGSRPGPWVANASIDAKPFR
jgi:hypothetical protein